MHTNDFSRRSVKRFADRLMKRLGRDGIAVSYPQILEAVAAAFEIRDWNTLSALLKDEPDIKASRSNTTTEGLRAEVEEWRLATAVSFTTSTGAPRLGKRSSLSTAELILAPPGRGKTVLLNTGSLAFHLAKHPLGLLPRLAVIDIGDASFGLAELMLDLLPEHRKHEIAFRRLRMTPETAINPFDTPLGQRVPDLEHRNLLLNILRILLQSDTPSSEQMSTFETDLCSFALDLCVKRWSDRERVSTPTLYTSGTETSVDAALARAHAEPHTWWDAVDCLFMAGEMREAATAQRYATPTLADFHHVLSTSLAIQDLFGQARTDNGVTLLVDVCGRLAQWFRRYPNLALRTGLRLDEARVVILDIDELAPRVGPYTTQQTALSYLLARHAAGGWQFLIDEASYSLDDTVATAYKAYHRRNTERPCRIVFDEIHRVASLKPVADQLLSDMQAARKWGLNLVVASQRQEDFNNEMRVCAGTVWIGGANNSADEEKLSSGYQLSPQAQHALTNQLRGPTSQGASFLVISQEIAGRFEEIRTLRLGSEELWAFATSTMDVRLRTIMYRRLGGVEARRRLAIRFPRGSAWQEIEKRIAAAGESWASADQTIVDQVLDQIADALALAIDSP